MNGCDYPLGQADRAFAYDGAYRAPNAMSAACRAAYGLHRRVPNDAQRAFGEALQRATVGSAPSQSVVARRRLDVGPTLIHSRPTIAVSSGCAQQRGLDVAALGTRASLRPRALDRQSPATYYLAVSWGGFIVRAMVRRGRVYSGGVRRCPISMR